MTPVETDDGIEFRYQGTGRLDPIIGQIRDEMKRVRRTAKSVSKANTTNMVAPARIVVVAGVTMVFSTPRRRRR